MVELLGTDPGFVAPMLCLFLLGVKYSGTLCLTEKGQAHLVSCWPLIPPELVKLDSGKPHLGQTDGLAGCGLGPAGETPERSRNKWRCRPGG